ncbi:3-oxoacyl-[acyl-carrier-protein] synthase 3 protein 1 [bacterium BMS3Abin07]|nr:3-oxoacyl-[acyl-carrier-protein] synthase 3 protein 1 [bacterium BMS3Abin07]GBE32087.1 3-oxoacyl-[acyl-carrier-protein] synthase 3 protein 1 [bacterium BMS3Bbin05]HDL20141.1 ketoacyl-ACP synthase III [Nitrospirota bacterium]HDO22846.1 ketoacyl-ACP synthase III [Nitrospirota bacterium]HDZ88309.1 ketoacyl-ACP synthase III [Nitrospirota bacterium]
MRAGITGTGSFVPEKVLTNHDIEKMVDTSDEWIIERTGIRERRIAEDGINTSDLAVEAAKRALDRACLRARDIDLIIVATVTGDMPLPSTACFVQKKLKAKKAAAFDINAACSGFTFGLSVANAYIKSCMAKRVLLIGAETLSRITDWEDRSTCVLLGDGAGAVVVEPSDNDSGIWSVDIFTDGSIWNLLNVPAGGSAFPASEETVKNRMHFLKMKGNETFKIAVRTLEKAVVDTLKKNRISASDVSLLVPHQANLRIIQATAKRLNMNMDKVVVNVDRYGNTSAASIPIALDEACRQGRIRKGDFILLESFGGGLTWSSALIKW